MSICFLFFTTSCDCSMDLDMQYSRSACFATSCRSSCTAEFKCLFRRPTCSLVSCGHYQLCARIYVRKKFFNGGILYTANGSASFNPQVLAITLSGDVHPQPGPLFDDTSTGRQADHHFPQNNISFFYANARSIVNKVDLLGLHLADKAYDVVVLVETHLDSSIADGKFFLRNTRSLDVIESPVVASEVAF